MTNLSININKIAWLRNARDGDIPNLVDMTMNIIDSGCHGITVHPRPDLRHITPKDVAEIKKIIAIKIPNEINSFLSKDIAKTCKLLSIDNSEIKNFGEVIKFIRNSKEKIILITGSLYLVGKIRSKFL